MVLVYTDNKFWILDQVAWERDLWLDLGTINVSADQIVFVGQYFYVDFDGQLFNYSIQDSGKNHAYDPTRHIFETNLTTGEQRPILNIANPVWGLAVNPDGKFLLISYIPPDQLPVNRLSKAKTCVFDLQTEECQSAEFVLPIWKDYWVDDYRYFVPYVVPSGEGGILLVDIRAPAPQRLFPEIAFETITGIPGSNQLIGIGQLQEREYHFFPVTNTYDIFTVDLDSMQVADLPYDIDFYTNVTFSSVSPDSEYLLLNGDGGSGQSVIIKLMSGEKVSELASGYLWTADSQNLLGVELDRETGKYGNPTRTEVQTGKVVELFENNGELVWLWVIP